MRNCVGNLTNSYVKVYGWVLSKNILIIVINHKEIYIKVWKIWTQKVHFIYCGFGPCRRFPSHGRISTISRFCFYKWRLTPYDDEVGDDGSNGIHIFANAMKIILPTDECNWDDKLFAWNCNLYHVWFAFVYVCVWLWARENFRNNSVHLFK